MANVFQTPDKIARKRFLFETAIHALQKDGWTVKKLSGSGKSSLRRISKDGRSLDVTIRTSQDTYVAFPLQEDGTLGTLNDVDAVIASSVDDLENPRFANVHFIDGEEMRHRYRRNVEAKRKLGHSTPVGRGIWIPLYEREADEPVYLVGAGAGLEHPPLARVPLPPTFRPADPIGEEDLGDSEPPLTIAEAKRRLAESLGVDPSAIKISVEA